jgi:hypothetical protein
MRTRLIYGIVLATAMAGVATAQEAGQPGGNRRQFAGMERVTGEITAVSGESVTVKAEDGGTYTVTTTPNTRLMKGQGVTIKVTDLKVGDGVMAAGNLDAPNKTLHAAMLLATDAEQVKKMRENLGKTFITGKVTAIDVDNLKMTILRTDGVSQTIGFDETTSFKRGGRGVRVGAGGGGGRPGAGGAGAGNAAADGGESITLADIKTGDSVVGDGAVKDGVFVPKQLNVLQPRAARGPRPAGAAGAVPPPS